MDGLGKRALEAAGTTTFDRLPIPRSLLWHLLCSEPSVVACATQWYPAVRTGEEVKLVPPDPPSEVLVKNFTALACLNETPDSPEKMFPLAFGKYFVLRLV